MCIKCTNLAQRYNVPISEDMRETKMNLVRMKVVPEMIERGYMWGSYEEIYKNLDKIKETISVNGRTICESIKDFDEFKSAIPALCKAVEEAPSDVVPGYDMIMLSSIQYMQTPEIWIEATLVKMLIMDIQRPEFRELIDKDPDKHYMNAECFAYSIGLI